YSVVPINAHNDRVDEDLCQKQGNPLHNPADINKNMEGHFFENTEGERLNINYMTDDTNSSYEDVVHSIRNNGANWNFAPGLEPSGSYQRKGSFQLGELDSTLDLGKAISHHKPNLFAMPRNKKSDSFQVCERNSSNLDLNKNSNSVYFRKYYRPNTKIRSNGKIIKSTVQGGNDGLARRRDDKFIEWKEITNSSGEKIYLYPGTGHLNTQTKDELGIPNTISLSNSISPDDNTLRPEEDYTITPIATMPSFTPKIIFSTEDTLYDSNNPNINNFTCVNDPCLTKDVACDPQMYCCGITQHNGQNIDTQEKCENLHKGKKLACEEKQVPVVDGECRFFYMYNGSPSYKKIDSNARTSVGGQPGPSWRTRHCLNQSRRTIDADGNYPGHDGSDGIHRMELQDYYTTKPGNQLKRKEVCRAVDEESKYAWHADSNLPNGGICYPKDSSFCTVNENDKVQFVNKKIDKQTSKSFDSLSQLEENDANIPTGITKNTIIHVASNDTQKCPIGTQYIGSKLVNKFEKEEMNQYNQMIDTTEGMEIAMCRNLGKNYGTIINDSQRLEYSTKNKCESENGKVNNLLQKDELTVDNNLYLRTRKHINTPTHSQSFQYATRASCSICAAHVSNGDNSWEIHYRNKHGETTENTCNSDETKIGEVSVKMKSYDQMDKDSSGNCSYRFPDDHPNYPGKYYCIEKGPSLCTSMNGTQRSGLECVEGRTDIPRVEGDDEYWATVCEKNNQPTSTSTNPFPEGEQINESSLVLCEKTQPQNIFNNLNDSEYSCDIANGDDKIGTVDGYSFCKKNR
ncbi:MAG: hypothetical protein HOM24_06655, partial [Flavobacteriales bacterium]|nr:hypothetical protein [Flavobacteriales bacterium]